MNQSYDLVQTSGQSSILYSSMVCRENAICFIKEEMAAQGPGCPHFKVFSWLER